MDSKHASRTKLLAPKKKKNQKKSMASKANVGAFLDESGTMRLSICVPDSAVKTLPPMDVVCVIDISYSMGGSAACQTDGKTEYEDLGFSLIDLVKHAVKTVIQAMRPKDRIAIVLFNSKITVPFEFTELTDQKRKQLLDFVDQIKQKASTNMFDALKKGIDLIMSRSPTPAQNRFKNEAAVLFFTDGQPMCGPYTGHEEIIKQINLYKDQRHFRYPIHTFAFGQYTNCTSSLLMQISESFNGMFGYIQDAKTLGTIFINGIAYTLSTAASSFKIMVQIDGKIIKPSHEFVEEQGTVALPGLRYGQSCDILYKVTDLVQPDSELSVTISMVNKGAYQFPDVRKVAIQKCHVNENLDHVLRFKTVKNFRNILDKFKTQGVEELQKETKDFVQTLKELESDSDFIPSLIDTVERQTVEMLAKQKYVEKWGEHQLRHLIRSLLMQCKGNFREQCLKDFGGDHFDEMADLADDIYNKMDPPTPSLAAQIAAKKAQAAVATNQIQNAQQFAQAMNNFDDDDDGGYYGGGCFHGDSIIKMHDGTNRCVKTLKKSDKIATPDGKGASIICVVKTETWEGKARMCQLEGGLFITPGHPIKSGSQWIYPRSQAETKTVNCSFFYNLIVDRAHIAEVNGVALILLGHNYTEGILKHEYLGSQKVVEDLKKVQGFELGLVELQQAEDGRIQRQHVQQKTKTTFPNKFSQRF